MADLAVAERQTMTAVVPLQTKLPEAASARGITREAWHVMKTVLFKDASDEMVCTLVDYCKARNLDPLKKPFHIVKVWDAQAGQMVDSIWPSIGETRITAFRTQEYAGLSDIRHGETMRQKVGGLDVTFPAWAQCSVFRMMGGEAREFVGPRVYWLETYAPKKGGAPNSMWSKRPYGQLDKCAEAAALRAAFPEENSMPTAEEMEGQTINGEAIDVTLPKDGNAGLTEFAGGKAEAPKVIDAESVVVTDTSAEAPESRAKARSDKDGPITFWASADEPARPLGSIGQFPHLLQAEIKKAKTAALASVIVTQNADLITHVDNVNGHTKFSQKIERLLSDRNAADGSASGGGSGKLL